MNVIHTYKVWQHTKWSPRYSSPPQSSSKIAKIKPLSSSIFKNVFFIKINKSCFFSFYFQIRNAVAHKKISDIKYIYFKKKSVHLAKLNIIIIFFKLYLVFMNKNLKTHFITYIQLYVFAFK